MAEPLRILVVRMGAMGDVIQCLPAVVSLKQGVPGSRITWVIDPRWSPLLDRNPFVDNVLLFDRKSVTGMLRFWRELRSIRYDIAVDFQGLLKSALVAAASRSGRRFGYTRSIVREKPAAWFYSVNVHSSAMHRVDRYLDLAIAVGASSRSRCFPLPEGRPEGLLPPGPFVLASPQAGWKAKQWPLEYYSELGRRLAHECGCRLVLNGRSPIEAPHTEPHVSGLPGLIDATRRATAIVGLDSGPLHLAAALGKSGVAIFGPTDPAQNGPAAGNFAVLRSPRAITTYKRNVPDVHMREITPAAVFDALLPALAGAGLPVSRSA